MLVDPYSGAVDSKRSVLRLGSGNRVNRQNCLTRFEGRPRRHNVLDRDSVSS